MQKKLALLIVPALLAGLTYADGRITPGDYQFETFSVSGTAAGVNALQVNRISDIGVIVGAQNTGSGEKGYLRFSTGTIVKFSDPLTSGAPDTFGFGINDFGRVVGTYLDTANNQFSGFFYSGGTFKTYNFPGLPPGSTTEVIGINNQGDFCGFYQKPSSAAVAFLSRDGHLETFTIPGSTFIEANSINEEGDVAGTYTASGVNHGFIREENGAITVIDVPGSGFAGTVLIGLNDQGWTAGHFFDSNNHEHGFARSPEGNFSQIDVPGADTTTPGLGTAGTGINNEGVVVGHYDPAGGGVEKGYIATPEEHGDDKSDP